LRGKLENSKRKELSIARVVPGGAIEKRVKKKK